VFVSEDEVLIKDDHGGSVALTWRDFDLIVEVVNNIRDNPAPPSQ